MTQQRWATVLQTVGLLVAAAAAALWNVTVGGLVLGFGLVLFGVAIERGDV